MNSGDLISRYRITRPLGKGGMGVVYLAEDARLNRPVALKFLPADALSSHAKQRFLNEAQAAALIRHPNICPIYDIEEADGQLFIAMAYLEGETLTKRIAQGRLPVSQAADIAIQIANGLEKAHSLGVVHRDIKSSNIIIGPDGHVSILDFGLALRLGGERLTLEGSAVGTPSYMSPEQAQGLPVDHRTDIWSLGVVLFEMLAGTLPFEREHALAIPSAIVHSEPHRLQDFRPDLLPAGLTQAVETALAKSPADRWQSAKAMAAALKPFTEGSGSPSDAAMAPTQVASSLSTTIPPKSRPLLKPLFAAAFLLLIAALAGVWLYRSRNAQPDSPSPPSAQQKLIAVLPFEVIGATPDTLAIANGLMEVLTAALSDSAPFQGKIAAIPSSEIRRRNIASADEARRVYGATLALTATAQPVGNSVRFNLQLIDPANSHQLAAKIFEYDPAKPVASRNRAIEELARLLSFDVNSARRAVSSGDTSTPEGYASYLKGRGLLARYDLPGNLDRAIALFRQAVQLDPGYALAHASLAESCRLKSRASGDKEYAQLALEHAERAVKLDPGLPVVHTTLAAVYTTSGREQDAIRELKQALQIAPSNAEAPRELARVYTALGRFDEAEAAYLQATRTRPTDWYGFLLLGLFYYQQLERYDDAVNAFQHALTLTPDNDLVYRNLGVVYLREGRYPNAVEVLQRSLKLKSNAATYSSLASTYFLMHRFPDAVSAIETAIDLDSNRYYYWGNLGIYSKWSPGSEGKSVPALQKAIEMGRRFLEVSPKDYDVRADLAEYYTRLGNKSAALEQISLIPESARRARMRNLATVFELLGNRSEAVRLLAANLRNPATLHGIQDDPDLTGLWSDAELQKAIAALPAANRR